MFVDSLQRTKTMMEGARYGAHRHTQLRTHRHTPRHKKLRRLIRFFWFLRRPEYPWILLPSVTACKSIHGYFCQLHHPIEVSMDTFQFLIPNPNLLKNKKHSVQETPCEYSHILSPKPLRIKAILYFSFFPFLSISSHVDKIIKKYSNLENYIFQFDLGDCTPLSSSLTKFFLIQCLKTDLPRDLKLFRKYLSIQDVIFSASFLTFIII